MQFRIEDVTDRLRGFPSKKKTGDSIRNRKVEIERNSRKKEDSRVDVT